MSATPNRTERRRHYDPTPRIEFVPVVDNTKLVSRDGYAHCALLALGWTVLILEPDFVLMQAPANFGETA